MFILICNFFFACEEKKEMDPVQEEWDFTAVWIDDCKLEIEIIGGEGEYYLGMVRSYMGFFSPLGKYPCEIILNHATS